MLILSDVTELRRLETVRRDFVANVSHELRTPVSVIRANAETLMDGAFDDAERARVFLEALHRNAERLSSIITDLLDLSRIESGRMVLDVKIESIAGVVRRAVEMVEKNARAKSQSINVSVAADLEARCDAKALEQVLMNLLDNAVKYTPSGTRIEIGALAAANRVRIEVRDNGPGIDPKHRSRIFERFYRVDPGRSRDMGGTGLGLAIVKHLVEAMGGEVRAEMNEPSGSIFLVLLPLN
ncbi:MAG: ATP-binding protein [Deltaproteobacteria bacterium]|nr:ATP-binding protein [Deltaproteobacteria bacterium]